MTPSLKPPKLVAHRGAMLVAPENTRAAAKAAFTYGASVIELDVRESVDGVLYVMHDLTVDRTTDGSGAIHLMTSKEIDALDAGRWFAPDFEGERVPRLDAYLEMIKQQGAGAYVKIKWCDAAKAAAIIQQSGIEERCFTFSFKPEMRAAMRIEAPNLRQMITLSIARTMSVAKSLYGACLVELEPSELTPSVVAAARAAGLDIMAYCENAAPEIFTQMMELGVDYINHNHLEVTSRLIADRYG